MDMKNLGTIDRIIRAIIGLAILYYAYAMYATSPVWAVILAVIGIGFLFTVIRGFCILYKFFGIKTIKENKEADSAPII